MTREEWLTEATELMRSGMFKRAGETVPHVRVSTGFPGGGSARKRIGECWNGKASDDGMPQVFISPVLSSSTEVLAVLAHELIHAIVPDAGHKAPFKRIALAIGLTGKMTATIAGPLLEAELTLMANQLGEYPHSKLNLSSRKKQGTRLNKAACASCGYTVRVTQKWLDEAGAPICPCNHESMVIS